MTVRLAWLFDIDGTLLLTAGAAKEAFVLATRDVLNRVDDLSDVGFAGRIEPQILADILAKHRYEPSPALIEHFWDAVVAHMRVVLTPGRGALLPGVPALLEAVSREPAWVSTVLTGNMTRMAEIKLGHYGIAQHFSLGAYGEQAASRDALACLAVRRIEERYGVPPGRCIAIGDTLHDIDCARAAGARAVAVATGPSSRAMLAAREPDLVLDDLARPEALLDWAREIARGE